LQVGQGGSDDLCAANVPFSPGEDDGDILSRAADAINADPGCIQAGVKGVFIDGGPEHIGEDEAGGAHFSLSAPTVAGTKLVTSVVAVPGVPSQACFTFDNLGTLATHALLISELTFSALPTGAKGGTVQVTERSMIGQCSVSVPTTAGQSAASIANAVNDALATSSIACPEEQNPQDVTVDADGHSLIFISAQQVVVCLHDDGLGFIFHPKEVDVVNICAAAVDTTPPVFTSVPPSMTISECTSPNIGQATATDSCGVTVTSDAPTSFHVGTTVVTWSAVDPAGNRTTATQTIKVVLGDDPSCCPVGTRVIMGTLGHDVLHGTPGSDCILGLDGADNINGGDGDDFISGGEGADHIVGGQGNDTLFGGDDNDTIEGNDGDDFIDGGGGSNNCSGSAGINTITRCRVSAGCTASCCATQTCSF
jgi:hypothetical protein